MKATDLGRLRKNLTQYFSDGELRDLAFDLGVDYESLPGQGKADKARELVAHLERRGRLDELREQLQRLRPGMSRNGPRPRRSSTWAVVIIATLAVAAVIVAIVLATRGAGFSYAVHVQDKDTGLDVPNAQITIYLGEGEAPATGTTDTHGYARIAIDTSHEGQPATLVVEAARYKRFTQAVTLGKDDLPLTVPLEPAQ